MRRSAAYVPEDKAVHGALTVAEFLRFHARACGDVSVESASQALEGLPARSGRKLRDLSKGQRSAVLLAAALSRRAPVLLADEPFEGLDPEAADRARARLGGWLGDGARAAVFASHQLEDVERICDRVIVLREGRVVLEGALDELLTAWTRIEVVGGLRAFPRSVPGRASTRSSSPDTRSCHHAVRAAGRVRAPGRGRPCAPGHARPDAARDLRGRDGGAGAAG